MPADDGLDSRIEQGVEDPVDLGARHPEDAGNALRLQITDQYLRTAGVGHRTLHRRCVGAMKTMPRR